jgi:hypothetical protein
LEIVARLPHSHRLDDHGEKKNSPSNQPAMGYAFWGQDQRKSLVGENRLAT